MIKLLKTKLFASLTLLLTIITCFGADYQVKDGPNSIGTLSLNEPYNSTNYFNKTNYYDVALYYTNIIDEYRTNIVYVYVTNPPVVLSNKFPIVKITSPTNNQIFNGNSSTINVISEATDSDGSISKVDFLVGGTLVNTDTSFPYSYSSLYGQGSYVLQTRAYDNSNAFSLSEIVNILVTNIPPPVIPTNVPPVGNARYVKAGATGNNSGSDWNNAYTSLPATLQRGATYYVAGGSYPSYTFNTVESGTSVITVKKASISDHGTDTGWVPSYGTSQAVFSSRIIIYKGYFVLDGQYRNESNWFDGDAYGFKIQNNNNWEEIIIRDSSGSRGLNSITIKHLHIAAVVGRLPDSNIRSSTINTDTYNSTATHRDGIFSHIYIDGGNNPFLVRGFINPVVEYCASWRTCGSSAFHGEVVNLFYNNGSATIRYNRFKDAYNGVSGYVKGGGTGVIAIAQRNGVEIYGNIFDGYYVGDGAIAAGWENYNIKVYNNTFVNGMQGSGAIVRFTQTANASGNVAYNNLASNCSNNTYNGKGTFGFNSTEPTSIFVNFNGQNFHLVRKTTISGTTLSSPFNIDPDKKTRASDGFWDIGAYEF